MLLGLVYPLVVTGIAQVAFHDKANGSLVEANGKVVGSSLIGQAFTDKKGNALPSTSSRGPSAADRRRRLRPGRRPDAEHVGSNLGPDRTPSFLERRSSERGRRDLPQARTASADGRRRCPVDAVTASGSGPRPAHLGRQRPAPGARASPTSAGSPLEQGRRSSIDEHTDGRALGFLGEQTVNVLELNLALDKLRAELVGSSRMARGTLRIYLGRRARRRQDVRDARTRAGARHERGTDVVVGLVETHGRPEHAGAARRPRGRPAAARSSTAARRSRRWTSTRSSPASPSVALVDELAHTNVPGSRNEKRWQDVEELLDAGIDVISTREHPAPRVGQRRRRAITGVKQQRDDARRGRARAPTRSSSST